MVALHVVDEDFYVLYSKVDDLLHKWMLLNSAGQPSYKAKKRNPKENLHTTLHLVVVTHN